MDISNTGQYLAAGNLRRLFLFNRTSATPLWQYWMGDSTAAVAMSTDGQYIAASTRGNFDTPSKIHLFHLTESGSTGPTDEIPGMGLGWLVLGVLALIAVRGRRHRIQSL